MSNYKSQKERSGNLPSKKANFTKCGKKYSGECLVGTENYLRCEKSGHKVRDLPNVWSQKKGSGQAQSYGPSSEDPNLSHFYTLLARSVQEESPAMVTDMIQAFIIGFHDLLDSVVTLSVLTPLVARKFYFLPDVSIETF